MLEWDQCLAVIFADEKYVSSGGGVGEGPYYQLYNLQRHWEIGSRTIRYLSMRYIICGRPMRSGSSTSADVLGSCVLAHFAPPSTRPFIFEGTSDSEWQGAPLFFTPPCLSFLLSESGDQHLHLRMRTNSKWVWHNGVCEIMQKLASNERGCWTCWQARFVRRSTSLLRRCHSAARPLLLCL